MSIKDEIAAGPKWSERILVGKDETGTPLTALCAACRALEYIDDASGLCRPCWRTWRFSAAVTHPWLFQPTLVMGPRQAPLPPSYDHGPDCETCKAMGVYESPVWKGLNARLEALEGVDP